MILVKIKNKYGEDEMAEKKSKKKSPMPKTIFAQVSPKSIGGVSMFNMFGGIDSETVSGFQSEDSVISESVTLLRQAGFEILQVTQFTINIAGSQKVFEDAFNTKLTTEDRSVIKQLGEEDTATFIECPQTDIPGFIDPSKTSFANLLEGVAIEEPQYFFASAFAPPKAYWHLDVPGDVSLATNADKAHRSGITGKGVKVAMVDSGHYKHPFFTKRGYRVAPVVLGPAATNPTKDESGHGTGESANIFAVAPDVQLLPVKISFVNSTGAFNAAVALNPDIITCSWGSSRPNPPLSAANQTLATAVASAWASGITVIFSAGNGQWGFPGQHPDVISAGGVFMDQDESLLASDYASGFMSKIYTNRRVPDLSGLVGMRPKAIYIMLPVEPGDDIDQGLKGGSHPLGDETTGTDGWAAFSGTSAAAPQLAGTAALMKQACKKLTPTQIRDIMKKAARDVTQGTCSPSTGSNAATTGPDLATGNGLVDSNKAVLLAKIRCLGTVVGPRRGIDTVRGPNRGIDTVRGPARGPVRGGPVRGPVEGASGPSGMASLEEASLEMEQHEGLSSEDIQALEDMVIKSELDDIE
jgi:hypothetical protein